MKKFYKDFKKVYIGTSDIASLTVRSVRNVYDLHFGIDGGYNAYECFGDVEIGEHYSKVFSGKSWLKIFDDSELVYSKHFDEFPFFDIYRAGNYGCIIHWHGEEAEKALKKHRPMATGNEDRNAKNKIEQAKENFLVVRDKLNADKSMSCAYRLAWKKPWKFYREHTPNEAIELLKVEADL